ncbi:SEM6D protein, partial [Polypterus senegalus]
MGMGIQLFLLLALLVVTRLQAVSFPEDDEPIDTIDYHYSRQYPVFRGRPLGNESQHRLDFQLMMKIQDTLFIAGRDQVYSVSLQESHKNEIVPYRDECHNFIKVFVPRNDDLVFICGTNAFNPMCRYYRLDNLEYDGEEISGLARCPFDARQTNVALFAEGKLYSATVADFLASDAVIYRSMGDGSALRTIKYDSKWLKEPHFLHAVEYGNYVYFFFREIAIEHTNLGKAVYSRVARICKNDIGGSQRVLEKHWTSFLKARLNCSVPGDSFFYFDVLQSITDIIDINGAPTVVGVFTTQLNRPGCCAGHGLAETYKTSIEFPDETLAFIKSHPLMDSAIPSVREEPWFTKTRVRYRLTAITVDNSAGPYQNYTVMFIGSEAGIVLKVLAKTASFSLNDSVFLEAIDAFNPAKCISNSEDDRRIMSLQLDKENHALFVAFSSCVIRMPLSRCERHGSCQNTGFEQDVEYGNTMQLGDCQEILATTATPDYKTFGSPTSDMKFSSPPVTTSGHKVSAKVIDSQKTLLISSRKFVHQDDPDTPDLFNPLSGIPKGKALVRLHLAEWKPEEQLFA